MAYLNDQDHDLLIVDGVDHAIPPHAEPKRVTARQASRVLGQWVFREALYGVKDALDIMSGNAPQVLLDRGLECNFIGCHQISATAQILRN